MSDAREYDVLKRQLAEIAEAASYVEARADGMNADQLREAVRLLAQQLRETQGA